MKYERFDGFASQTMHRGGGTTIGDGYMGIVDGIRRANGFGCWAGCPSLDGGVLGSGYGFGKPREYCGVANGYGLGGACGGGDNYVSGTGTLDYRTLL